MRSTQSNDAMFFLAEDASHDEVGRINFFLLSDKNNNDFATERRGPSSF